MSVEEKFRAQDIRYNTLLQGYLFVNELVGRFVRVVKLEG